MGVDFDPKEYPNKCFDSKCGSPSYNSFGGTQGNRSFCTSPECEAFDVERLGKLAEEHLPTADDLEKELAAKEEEKSFNTRLIEASNKIEAAKREAELTGEPVFTAAQVPKLCAVGPKPPSNPEEGRAWIDVSDPAKPVFNMFIRGNFYNVTTPANEGQVHEAAEQFAKDDLRLLQASYDYYRKCVGPKLLETPDQHEARIAYHEAHKARYPAATNSTPRETPRETLEDYRRWTKEHILPLLSKLEKADSTCRHVESAIKRWDDEIGVGIERLKDVEKEEEKKHPLMEGFLGCYHMKEQRDYSHIRPTQMKPISNSLAQAERAHRSMLDAMQDSFRIPSDVMKATSPLRTADQLREMDRECRRKIHAKFKVNPTLYRAGTIKNP